jgi:hypothetical protein
MKTDIGKCKQEDEEERRRFYRGMMQTLRWGHPLETTAPDVGQRTGPKPTGYYVRRDGYKEHLT